MKQINNSYMTSAMRIDSLAKELAKSNKIYNLSAGDPNSLVEGCIVNSYENLDIQNSHNYCSSQGLYELRSKLDKPENVIISNGAKELIYLSLISVTHPGDEVVIIGPCWPSYMEICKILGLKYRLLVGKEIHHYVPTYTQIKESITSKTAAVLFNNPNNPTGVVYDTEFVYHLWYQCVKNNTWLISDEIYNKLLYSSVKFTTLKNKNNVIYINGFSKTYGLTGWRLGYAIGPKNVISSMTSYQSQISGPPNTLVQQIILNCYDEIKGTNLNIYRNRINLLCDYDEYYNKHRPEGGFYFYLPVNTDSNKLCEKLLKKHHIALTPGDEYGQNNTVRLSIASITLEDLDEILPILTTELKGSTF